MPAAASGRSSHPQTLTAVTEAVDLARAKLQGVEPTVGFIFASSKHDWTQVITGAMAAVPGCEFLGSQTAGEFTEEGPLSGGLVVLLTSLKPGSFQVSSAGGLRADPIGTAQRLTSDFADLERRAMKRGAALSTSVLLADGLSGNGEKLVREVLNHTRLFQQIVGGAAGDDGAFVQTQVGRNRFVGSDAAVALHVFGKEGWGIGVDHGLVPRSKVMTVTRASGSTLHELDSRPAFDVYRDYARTRGVTLTPENAAPFLIANELGVFFLNELHHARAPVGVGPEGELKLVADITRGAQVCILDGEPPSLVAAARRAAERARGAVAGPVAAVLVFDCVCRGLILKDDFAKEISAIAEVFPSTPIAGFLTYGEIARYRGKLDGWHNTTAVVVAIPASAQGAAM
jgi:hypothetical protein